MTQKINIVTRARLVPKGVRGKDLLDQVLYRGGDIIRQGGDILGEEIGDRIGGAIGGEIGAAVGDILSNSIPGISSGSSYFQGPAKILGRTGGLVFPNTPNISTGHEANWEDYDIPHTNYGYWAFKNSRPSPITVHAKFTVNTRTEADYLLGVVHFLRSVTKMHFGVNDKNKGTPPPVLEFYAMGDQQFNFVPVVVTNVNFDYEDTTDYVASGFGSLGGFNTGFNFSANNLTFVPATTYVNITMQPYYNPSAQQNEFNLEKFKRGELLNKGYI